MIDSIINFSIIHRWFILLITLGIITLGLYDYQRLPIDAVPDITNVQVQINAEAQGYSPQEVEQRITFPIENSMAGLPELSYTRSLSRYGLSQVTVAFQDGTDIYWARQLISERLQEIKEKLPPGIEPTMGPIATGLGEIYMYIVEYADPERNKDTIASQELRTIQDWIVKPQLRNVKGVIEVNGVGGYRKQIHITPYPDKLHAYDLSLSDVLTAIEKNNQNVGSGYIELNGEQYLIRSHGQIIDLNDIGNIVLKNFNGTPIHIHDVADVILGKELRTGAATNNGNEVVLGTVFMLMGENSRTVSKAVAEKIKEVQHSLPEGVVITTVYDRTDLVDDTINTVKTNLFEGAVLVIAILLLLLGNVRAALITAFIIPLSMLFTITGMVATKISGNLMSLGAIDFGIIIDGAVIIVENCLKRLGNEQHRLGRVLEPEERFKTVFEATKEVFRPSFFGVLIIMIVYLPILTLTDVEGKMFHPMAFTVLIALTGALIFSATFIPAAIAIFLTGKVSEQETFIVRMAKKVYEPILKLSLDHARTVITGGAVVFALTLMLATQIGSEFLPTLDEGDIAMHALRIPGTSLTQALEMQHVLENRIKKLPEVKEVFSKIGTAEIATDPMPPSVADGFIILKSRSEWPDPKRAKSSVISDIEELVKTTPGNNYEFTQPIQMRFNELIAGVRTDMAVMLFGDNMDQLMATGEEIETFLKSIPGAADVKMEQTTGLPIFSIDLNREAMARYGLNITDVQELIEIAMGGKSAGQVFEGDRRFDIIVRLPEEVRTNFDAVKSILIPTPNSKGFIPLSEVANFNMTMGPNQINRENGKRVAIITANVRGRDLGSFVEEAQAKINDKVKIPAGYWLGWGGQFEHLLSGTKRLQIVVPIALALIFLLLITTFNSIKDAMLVFTGVPLALTGGVLLLWLRDIPFSISAGIGFIALSGVAVLNGVVMISFIRKLREEGLKLYDAVYQGSLGRLRPVLMTALVASFGFIPMAIACGRGAEVQKPLATVVIGGIISSTLLTLLVLPALYYFFNRKEEEV